MLYAYTLNSNNACAFFICVSSCSVDNEDLLYMPALKQFYKQIQVNMILATYFHNGGIEHVDLFSISNTET